MFKSPKRRSVRQRSGYKVSGATTGSEAQVLTSEKLEVVSKNLTIQIENDNVELVPQFDHEVGMVGIGGFINTTEPIHLSYELEVFEASGGDLLACQKRIHNLSAGCWNKFGFLIELDDPRAHLFVKLKSTITIEHPTGQPIGDLNFHGVSVDVISRYDSETVDDEFGKDAYVQFKKKTDLYYPEIFYWDHVEPFLQEYTVADGSVSSRKLGKQIVTKACNRCSRFLPIDLENERNTLGFSNHCVKRAPCSHRAFSCFSIENLKELAEAESITLDLSTNSNMPPTSVLDTELAARTTFLGTNTVLTAHYGYQLECRPCKKFFVNAPLNPLRNTAQRREDSLRRRAVEAMLRELLDRDWIFYKFRRQGRKEFDQFIWEKFDKKCFGCGISLESPKDMDLDHTLPLVYLWPLDEGATCLCSSCNSSKHDKFPFEFEPYQEKGKLERLANITGLHQEIILSRKRHVNPAAVDALRNKIEWLFDDFLAQTDYQKIRDGKLTADLILASLQRVLDECNVELNLVREYVECVGHVPDSVSTKAMSLD